MALQGGPKGFFVTSVPPEPPGIGFLTDHPPVAVRGKMKPDNVMKPAIPERRPATEEISGVIERVTLHNDDSGFCVL